MKTLLQQASRVALLTACTGLFSTSVALAQSSARPQPVNVDKVGDNSYLIRVSNPQRQMSELKVIRTKDNAVLFEKYTKRPAFGSRLNVRELPDGEYAFLVKTGKDVTRYTLDIHTKTERTTRLGSVSMMALAD